MALLDTPCKVTLIPTNGRCENSILPHPPRQTQYAEVGRRAGYNPMVMLQTDYRLTQKTA